MKLFSRQATTPTTSTPETEKDDISKRPSPLRILGTSALVGATVAVTAYSKFKENNTPSQEPQSVATTTGQVIPTTTTEMPSVDIGGAVVSDQKDAQGGSVDKSRHGSNSETTTTITAKIDEAAVLENPYAPDPGSLDIGDGGFKQEREVTDGPISVAP